MHKPTGGLDLETELDARLCHVLLGWEHLEQSSGGPSIVDFNVSGLTAGESFTHRYDVLVALQGLSQVCDPASFAFERVRAHETYLRALMGQQIAFDEYLQATQGVVPSIFSQEYLSSARSLAEHDLRSLGIDVSQPVQDQLVALDPPLSSSKVDDRFRSLLRDYGDSLQTVIGRDVQFDLAIEWVDVPEYWAYWVDGQGDSFRLRLNRRKASFGPHECLQFTFHELLAHCGQMQAWGDLISESALPKYFGITTVHSPEQFMSEGLAQVLPLLIPSPAAENHLLRARLSLMRYELLLTNNLHCMVNLGEAIEGCLEYYYDHSLQRKARETICDDLASRSLSPLYRSYQYVYPKACELFWNAAKQLSPFECEELVRFCFRGPCSPRDLESLVYSPEVRGSSASQ